MCVGLLSCANCIIFLSSRLSICSRNTHKCITTKAEITGADLEKRIPSVTFDIENDFSSLEARKIEVNLSLEWKTKFPQPWNQLFPVEKTVHHCVNWLMHIWQKSYRVIQRYFTWQQIFFKTVKFSLVSLFSPQNLKRFFLPSSSIQSSLNFSFTAVNQSYLCKLSDYEYF